MRENDREIKRDEDGGRRRMAVRTEKDRERGRKTVKDKER